MARSSVLESRLAQTNPANPPPTLNKRRIPMSTQRMSGEVPEVPGFYLYWFNESNVDRALEAGYSFVNRGEVETHNMGIASNRSLDGNSDLGTRVSRPQGAGTFDVNGQPSRQYLMKLPNALREEDLVAQLANSEELAKTLRGERSLDGDHYVNQNFAREMKRREGNFLYPRK